MPKPAIVIQKLIDASNTFHHLPIEDKISLIKEGSTVAYEEFVERLQAKTLTQREWDFVTSTIEQEDNLALKNLLKGILLYATHPVSDYEAAHECMKQVKGNWEGFALAKLAEVHLTKLHHYFSDTDEDEEKKFQALALGCTYLIEAVKLKNPHALALQGYFDVLAGNESGWHNLEQARNAGNLAALLYMGLLKKDEAGSISLLTEAAEKGSVDAMAMLAEKYQVPDSKYMPFYPAGALLLFQQAAQCNHISSIKTLAEWHESGVYTEKNLATAAWYYRELSRKTRFNSQNSWVNYQSDLLEPNASELSLFSKSILLLEQLAEKNGEAAQPCILYFLCTALAKQIITNTDQSRIDDMLTIPWVLAADFLLKYDLSNEDPYFCQLIKMYLIKKEIPDNLDELNAWNTLHGWLAGEYSPRQEQNHSPVKTPLASPKDSTPKKLKELMTNDFFNPLDETDFSESGYNGETSYSEKEAKQYCLFMEADPKLSLIRILMHYRDHVSQQSSYLFSNIFQQNTIHQALAALQVQDDVKAVLEFLDAKLTHEHALLSAILCIYKERYAFNQVQDEKVFRKLSF